ncbi:formylglycine-generating enzyme family protein [Leptothoe sp. LEGE 181152]|nr:formylglycine-generating enzyme family protein [Leptothoe sp. LEGE 181152]
MNQQLLLEEMIARLHQAKIDWDAEKIADVLWLAQHIAPTSAVEPSTPEVQPEVQPEAPLGDEPAVIFEDIEPGKVQELPPPPDFALYAQTPKPPVQPQPQSHFQGLPFKTPTAPALRRTLAMGRSLRPLMRRVDAYEQTVLDENATAEATAECQICMTVIKPAKERWLEVALVIEQTASSFIWQDTIEQFKLLLASQGAFRRVSLWYLDTLTEGQIQLLAKDPEKYPNQPNRSPKELLDAAGRRLILLVSDCISWTWRQGMIQQDYLSLWATHGPVALVQLLPETFWERTVLSAGLPVQLSALMPGMTNPKLRVQEVPLWEEIPRGDGLKLPIITLEPNSLKQWAKMLAGLGNCWATGVWFDKEWQSEWVVSRSSSTDLSAAQLVKRFYATASPMAKRLAKLMATGPVSLPVVYLIQAKMLPDSTPMHVAEVFMSGLVERTNRVGTLVGKEYDFLPEVRELLLDAVSKSEAESLLDKISEFVGEKIGKTIYSFTALLMLETELGDTANAELLKFANVSRQVLRRLGGEYAALVHATEGAGIRQPSQSTSPMPNFPVLGTLTFETARFSDEEEVLTRFSLLPAEEGNGENDSLEFEDNVAGLLPFEFMVATLEPQRNFLSISSELVVKRQRAQNWQWIETFGDDLTLEMVAIPGGNFRMGSVNIFVNQDGSSYIQNEDGSSYIRNNPSSYYLLSDNPMHMVTVPAFLMGKYPVTQAQWNFVAGLPPISRLLESDPSEFKGANRPVERVNWHEAVEFCERLSRYTQRDYRLPTEAEWEYACRAGTTTLFHFGETLATAVANYDCRSVYGYDPTGAYLQETTPVDHFNLGNAFGLCDMHGNIWEWCQDNWHSNYKGAPTDGSAWMTKYGEAKRVCRGGSWLSKPRECRSTHRNYFSPGNHSHSVGFRVACSSFGTLA